LKPVLPLLASAALLSAALPAHAGIRCSEWTRLAAEQRAPKLQQLYAELRSEPRLKKYDVNWGRINQCLVRETPSIEVDFDDACAQGQRVSLNVLDEILRSYALSCVNR
jgi:hypothetical protein